MSDNKIQITTNGNKQPEWLDNNNKQLLGNVDMTLTATCDKYEPKKTFPEDKVFAVRLSEDEIDQCTHAINELCASFVQSGLTLDNDKIQSYLRLANKLEALFNNNTYPPIALTKDTPIEQRVDVVAAWLKNNDYSENSLVSFDESGREIVVVDVQRTIKDKQH